MPDRHKIDVRRHRGGFNPRVAKIDGRWTVTYSGGRAWHPSWRAALDHALRMLRS